MADAAEAIKRLKIRGEDRAEQGIIVQFDNGLCRHFVGENVKEALKKAASFADKYETKITVLSNPATIYRDLQGTRQLIAPKTDRYINDQIALPELKLLALINRKDLYNGI